MFGFFNKVTDPVCGMKIDNKSEYSSDYEGTKFYFCSENCLKQFNAAPKKFVADESASMQSCCQEKAKSCCS